MQGIWNMKDILVHVGVMTRTGCATTREPHTDSNRRITSWAEMPDQVDRLPEIAAFPELGRSV